METQASSEKNLTLVWSEDPLVVKLIIKHLSPSFHVIYHSPESVFSTPDHIQVRKIKEKAIHLLPQLKEPITHAIIHISTQKDKKFISSMLPKFRANKTHVIILLPIREYQRNYDVVLATKHYPYATYIFYGDLYGKDIPYTYSPVAKRLHFAFKEKVFTLQGDDLTQIFPIHAVDFVTLVKDLAEKNIEGHYFFSFYEKPETLLSLAHYIKRAEPELSLMIKHDSPLRFTEDNRQTLVRDIKRRFMFEPEYQNRHILGFERSLEELTRNPQNAVVEPKRGSSIGTILYYIIVMLGLVFFVFDLASYTFI